MSVKIFWKHDDYGHPDPAAVTADKETLRAWEDGIITISQALADIARHNADSYERLRRYSDGEVTEYFKGLGYIRGRGDE